MIEEAPPVVWVLTAMTGAGAAAVVEALTAAGVRVTDNLPPSLLGAFVDRPRRALEVVVVDARQGDEVASCRVPEGAHVVFLDAPDDVLVRRAAETTTAHPCAAAGAGRAAVAAERALLGELRGVAEVVVDAGDRPDAEVASRVLDSIGVTSGLRQTGFAMTVSSFGFKYGPQAESDWVVDVRFLPNPFWVATLRPRTGLDPEVSAYVLDGEDGRHLLDSLVRLLSWVATRSRERGRHRVHVALGCTGGRHRSVAVAAALAARLEAAGVDVDVRHRDVDRPDPR